MCHPLRIAKRSSNSGAHRFLPPRIPPTVWPCHPASQRHSGQLQNRKEPNNKQFYGVMVSASMRVGHRPENTFQPFPPPAPYSSRKQSNSLAMSSMSKKVGTRRRSPSYERFLDGLLSCDSPNTSRRFVLGASNVCLVGENPTCSVPAQ